MHCLRWELRKITRARPPPAMARWGGGDPHMRAALPAGGQAPYNHKAGPVQMLQDRAVRLAAHAHVAAAFGLCHCAVRSVRPRRPPQAAPFLQRRPCTHPERGGCGLAHAHGPVAQASGLAHQMGAIRCISLCYRADISRHRQPSNDRGGFSESLCHILYKNSGANIHLTRVPPSRMVPMIKATFPQLTFPQKLSRSRGLSRTGLQRASAQGSRGAALLCTDPISEN